MYQVTKCFIALADVTGLKLKLMGNIQVPGHKVNHCLTDVTGLKLKLKGNIQVSGH